MPTLDNVTNQMVDDILATALEGGSNYWIERIEPSYIPDGVVFISEVLTRGAHIKVFEHAHIAYKALTEAAMKYGIVWAAKHYDLSLEDFYEQHDAEMADVALQYALYGQLMTTQSRWTDAVKSTPARAFHAMMAASDKYDMPKYYKVDLATNAETLYAYKLDKFVWVMRDCGAHLYWRSAFMSALSFIADEYPEARYFIYDTSVEPEYPDDYDSLLREVTAYEAKLFLSTLPT